MRHLPRDVVLQTMRSSFVIPSTPFFDDYTSFGQTSQYFRDRTFFANASVESSIAVVLPRVVPLAC